MAAVTVRSDLRSQESKLCRRFHIFSIYLPWTDRNPSRVWQIQNHFLSQKSCCSFQNLVSMIDSFPPFQPWLRTSCLNPRTRFNFFSVAPVCRLEITRCDLSSCPTPPLRIAITTQLDGRCFHKKDALLLRIHFSLESFSLTFHWGPLAEQSEVILKHADLWISSVHQWG